MSRKREAQNATNKITMKKTLILASLLFVFGAYAQNQTDSIVYFDKSWKNTTKDKAAYYSVRHDADKKEGPYRVTDYYVSGTKQMEGQYLDKNYEKKIGKFIWYYDNGNISSISHFKNYEPFGKGERYFRNGNICYQSDIGTQNKMVNAWDENGNQIAENGDGLVYILTDAGDKIGKCQVKNGLKHGRFVGVINHPKSSFNETYENGKLKYGISIDSVGNNYVYKEIQEMPILQTEQFAGFGQYFNNEISKSSVFKVSEPVKIWTKFTVSQTGEVQNVSIIEEKSPKGNHRLKKQIIEVIRNSPNWIPGKSRGIPINAVYSIPISLQPSK